VILDKSPKTLRVSIVFGKITLKSSQFGHSDSLNRQIKFMRYIRFQGLSGIRGVWIKIIGRFARRLNARSSLEARYAHLKLERVAFAERIDASRPIENNIGVHLVESFASSARSTWLEFKQRGTFVGWSLVATRTNIASSMMVVSRDNNRARRKLAEQEHFSADRSIVNVIKLVLGFSPPSLSL